MLTLLKRIFVFLASLILLSFGSQTQIKYSPLEKNLFDNEISRYRLTNGDTLVDIGSGSGKNDEIIFKFYPNMFFILEDIDSTYMKQSDYSITIGNQKRYFRDQSLRIVGTNEIIPLPSEKYKNVLCRITLHEFTEPTKMIQEMYRILSPSGKLIIEERIPKYPDEFEKGCQNKLLQPSEIQNMLVSNHFNLISCDSINTFSNKKKPDTVIMRFTKK